MPGKKVPILGAQFRKDVKLAQRRGKDMEKLRAVVLAKKAGTI